MEVHGETSKAKKAELRPQYRKTIENSDRKTSGKLLDISSRGGEVCRYR